MKFKVVYIMRSNSFKTWSLALALLLASSCLEAASGDLSAENGSERANLEAQAKAGDKDAQGELNMAAYCGWLGFTPATGRAYLEAQAEVGNVQAQSMLDIIASQAKAQRVHDNDARVHAHRVHQ